MVLLAYLDPGSMMPIASAFAAIVGVMLMLWNKIKNFFVGLFRGGQPKSTLGNPDAPPGGGSK
ncbi:MAG: hypothetical protein U1D55_12735 [Phycisphaerae bacterium]